MEEHINNLKLIAAKRGILHLANILESDLKLTTDYRTHLFRCVFDDDSLDKMTEVSDIPSLRDLRRAEMILEELSNDDEDVTLA
ncbi:MAG: hypothetical protein LBL44_08390 [Treponema sp.]|jgi:hypothetical protein|nr:hypothetical protein [Treponema sp.]